MRGETFQGLKNLRQVLLRSNVCINQDFVQQMEFAVMFHTINEKCGTDEIEELRKHYEAKIRELEDSLHHLRVENKKLRDKLKACRVEPHYR
jgi:regulator of replication initiation timing